MKNLWTQCKSLVLKGSACAFVLNSTQACLQTSDNLMRNGHVPEDEEGKQKGRAKHENMCQKKKLAIVREM